MKNAKFTARTFDKATFESKHRRGRSCNSDSKKNAQQVSQAHRIQLAPFNLSTETRGRQKTKKQLDDQANEEAQRTSASFRARKMPTYKFFEAVKASDQGAPKELKFDEFKLSQSRERKSLPLDSELQALRKA